MMVLMPIWDPSLTVHHLFSLCLCPYSLTCSADVLDHLGTLTPKNRIEMVNSMVLWSLGITESPGPTAKGRQCRKQT